nr:hypothetical protein [Tanacetum cinerariifolium]
LCYRPLGCRPVGWLLFLPHTLAQAMTKTFPSLSARLLLALPLAGLGTHAAQAQAPSPTLFTNVAAYDTGVRSSPNDVAVADINNDGLLDILTANAPRTIYYANSGSVGVLLGTGAGSFGAVTTFTTNSFPNSIAAADVNGDGKPDVITTFSGVDVMLGTGTGSFGAVTSYPGGNNNAVDVAVADVNGDGKPDLLTANSGSGTAGVMLNMG